MKIRHTPWPGTWSPEREVVYWLAEVDSEPTIFGVSRLALERLMDASAMSPEECLSAFVLQRQAIERAAASAAARSRSSVLAFCLIEPHDLPG